MSEQVQTIVEAVRSLSAEQRQELMEALAAIGAPRRPVTMSRKQLIDSIKGKYRHIPTSSESFMSRKREDVTLESWP
ncbi:MAG: hypothetical protein EXQ52_18700 [Bryobacterales bacterium]|nr:hypothetical protein [Bryobacterales bacterium]